MRTPTEMKGIARTLLWPITALLHGVLVYLISLGIFGVGQKASVLIGVAAYATVWLWNPVGWHRRVFVACKVGWLMTLVGSIQCEAVFGLKESTNTVRANMQSDWVPHICATVIMLTLLVLDYLNRRQKNS